MSKIIFTKGASSFTFSCGRVFPVPDAAEVAVSTDKSDGGQLYAYVKGFTEQYFDLVYENLSLTDYNNFDAWLKTTVIGPSSTFTMTDENGVTHIVRLMDTKNPLRWVGYGKYAGTIHLREEI